LPDKAIDLVDEASSRVKMRIYTQPESIKKLEDKIIELDKEKEDAIRSQDFEKAAKLRDKVKEEKEKLAKEKEKWRNKNTKSVTTLTEEDIAEVVSSWTGVPVQKLTQSENEKLKSLETILHQRVVGQNEAIEAISKAIKAAEKNVIKVNLVEDRTLSHDCIGVCGAAKVLIKPAPAGRGIVAGGPVRNVLELAGVKDIVSKSLGSNTQINTATVAVNFIVRPPLVVFDTRPIEITFSS